MAECELLATCTFFAEKLGSSPATAGLMKDRYCLGDSAQCARHKVSKAIGRDKVPVDLFPNQNDRAEMIIQSA